jgi:hypothetical protein
MTGTGLGEVVPFCPGYLAAAMDELQSRIESQDPDDHQFVTDTFK